MLGINKKFIRVLDIDCSVSLPLDSSSSSGGGLLTIYNIE